MLEYLNTPVGHTFGGYGSSSLGVVANVPTGLFFGILGGAAFIFYLLVRR